jgi:hypothetical protein
VWLVLTTSAVTVLTWPNPRVRATVAMGWGLILLWIGLCGSLMVCFRESIRAGVLSIPVGWKTRFILFATVLALVEEAITTTMTNLAPLFGVKIGQAYITASTNYIDVVGLHSVVIFVPLFVGWAIILSRYAFSPFSVFVLFGVTGTIMETNFWTRNPLESGLWMFVYGLMVYLPAYCLQIAQRGPCIGGIIRWLAHNRLKVAGVGRLAIHRRAARDHLGSCAADDAFNHFRFGVGIVLHIFPGLTRQLSLGLLVELSLGWVFAQAVPQQEKPVDLH